jgi:Tubulin domain
MQQKKISKMINTARTLSSISPLSTLYCPIVDPPHNLPAYLNVDLQSQWYTSALIASAVETVTVPSRLRSYRNFEASLMGHRGGSQTIFELQSSVIPLDAGENRPSWAIKGHATHESADEAKLDFDLNFTMPEPPADDTTTFTQVQVFRGEEKEPAAKDDSLHAVDIGLSRKLRLYASKPAVERFAYHIGLC